MRTSPTGTWTSSERGVGGFTLVELLLVVALLGVLAALVLPRMAGGDELETAGRSLARLMRVTHAEALATRTPHELHLDRDLRAYWIMVVTPGGARAPHDPDLARRKMLPATVRFGDAQEASARTVAADVAVLTVPGSRQPGAATLQVLNDRDELLAVSLDWLTGRATLSHEPGARDETGPIPEAVRLLLQPLEGRRG